MWLINEEGATTYIDAKNLNMFRAKGWKMYTPKAKEEIQEKPVKSKRKTNKK